MHNSPTAASTRPFDVLVADDDAGVRELLADFLGGRGLEVATTPDGRAAVTALERSGRNCRLVFADIAMPGADGFEVLNAARHANPASYVVIITGYGSLETAVNAVRQGAQDYLTKPFSLGQVDIILGKANDRMRDAAHRVLAEGPIAAALGSIDARLSAMETQMRAIAQSRTR